MHRQIFAGTSAGALIALLLAACASSPRQTPGPVAVPQPPAQQMSVSDSAMAGDSVFVMPDITKFTRMQNGLMYYDVNIGAGITAVNLREVQLHYTGMFQDGTIFDTSRRRGVPIRFTLGQGRVIRGWDQGIRGMKVGGRRIIIVPPELAYGSSGNETIPPNSTLIFDLQLVSVR